MLNISVSKLSKPELSIHNKMAEAIEQNHNIKILEAAQFCDVSPSKISKLVRKLGFENFKQYKQYFGGQAIASGNKKRSSELERLQHFIESFNPALIDQFMEVYQRYNKIVLFGLGPSFFCVEYFSYKLAPLSDKSIFVTQSQSYAQNLVDKETLLIVFSVTGKFDSFESLFHRAKSRGTAIMLILEEYDGSLTFEADHLFYLTKSTQNEELLPFEKTRTVFFIFIEEVIARFMSERADT
ncbi:SIS domain-containing protein [Paenibacillus sp. PL2-23]|uniref:MurR/RpiR family transcriptional regulator n=1 Tax=Paenibacillus sp. PL2-23 TaxID=2100729 RepID=UPI0030F7EBC6